MKQVVEYLQALATFALVLAGVGGLSYHAFREDGWIETAVGNIWQLEFQYPLIAVPLTIAAIVVFKLWRDGRIVHGRTSRLTGWLIYGLMAAGAYFIGSYALHGTL